MVILAKALSGLSRVVERGCAGLDRRRAGVVAGSMA